MSDQPTPTTARIAGVVAVLSLLGFSCNLSAVWVGYGLSLVFGGVFPLAVTVLFGVRWGLASALVASSATWIIWYHPYAIVIMTAEVAFVGLALARGRRNIVLADTLYWLVLGMPLVFVFYHMVMHINVAHTGVIALKQMLNGILDALVASILVSHCPLRRWLSLGRDRVLVSYAQIVFHATSTVVLLSSFVILVLLDHRQVDEMQRAAIAELQSESQEQATVVADWLRMRTRALEEVARLARDLGARPSPMLQESLRQTVGLFPDLHNAYVADKAARTVAFYPPRNERGESTLGLDFSDRAYYHTLLETMRPTVTGVFTGRGGVFVPIFAVAVPIVDNGHLAGFALAAADLDHLRAEVMHHIQPPLAVTIVDAEGKVVVSTLPQYEKMQAVPVLPNGSISEVAPGVHLFVPGLGANTSIMETWKDACYFTRTPLPDAGWSVRVESPIAPLQDAMYVSTFFNLQLLLGVFLVGILLSHLLGRGLGRTPMAVAQMSRAVPEQLRSRSEIVWPQTGIAEMAAFIQNFKETADELGARMREIEESNVVLEQRVRDRTEALRHLTENLERRVEEQIALRARDEQMLVHQSKMAAMGEMLGAIAHQWRQPLNTLALCIQNLQVSWDEGDFGEQTLQLAVERAMRQIRHMSKTIDDFRDFFRSNREDVLFDAGRAADEVLRLFSAQLQANRIEVRVVCSDHDLSADTVEGLPCRHEWTVFGVPGEYEHVVLNLLSNAKDAILQRRRDGGEAGHVQFELSLASGRFHLRVEDDGCGLPAPIRDRIFEPYFTTKEESKGTGMGLYISRVIVEDHFKGTLSAHPLARGTSMVVSLPCGTPGRTEEEAREHAATA